jgi:hypothetical protein
MPNYTDPSAVADRLRSATASLTRGDDAAAVRAYLHELEDMAREWSLGGRPRAIRWDSRMPSESGPE